VKNITTALVIGLIGLPLVGCSAAASSESESPLVEKTGSSPVVAVGTHSPGEPTDLALIQGDLGVTEQGCFGLKWSDGPVMPVLFQKGTTLLSDLSGISVPSYGDIALGDFVSGSGGFVTTRGREDLDIPTECLADEIAYVTLT
jgi:hypothetical protein